MEKVKKITDFSDFLTYTKELEEAGVKVKSLEDLISLISVNIVEEYMNKTFIVPMSNCDFITVVSPAIFPGPLSKIANFEYTITIMTISHFIYLSMFIEETYIVID